MQPRCRIHLHYPSMETPPPPSLCVSVFVYLVYSWNGKWYINQFCQLSCRPDIYTWSLFTAPLPTLKVEPMSGSDVGGEREIWFPAFRSPKECPVSSSPHICQHRAMFHSEVQGTAALVLRWPCASLCWKQHRWEDAQCTPGTTKNVPRLILALSYRRFLLLSCPQTSSHLWRSSPHQRSSYFSSLGNYQCLGRPALPLFLSSLQASRRGQERPWRLRCPLFLLPCLCMYVCESSTTVYAEYMWKSSFSSSVWMTLGLWRMLHIWDRMLSCLTIPNVSKAFVTHCTKWIHVFLGCDGKSLLSHLPVSE